MLENLLKQWFPDLYETVRLKGYDKGYNEGYSIGYHMGYNECQQSKMQKCKK